MGKDGTMMEPSCDCPVRHEPDGRRIRWCSWFEGPVELGWALLFHPQEALTQVRGMGAEWHCPWCDAPAEATLAEMVVMGGPNIWVDPLEYDDATENNMLFSVRCSQQCGWRTTVRRLLEAPPELETFFELKRDLLDSWAGLWSLETLERTHPILPDQLKAWRRYLGYGGDEDDAQSG